MSGRGRAGLSRISSNREEFPGCRCTAPFRQSAAYVDRSIASEIEKTVSFHYSEVNCTIGAAPSGRPLLLFGLGAVAHLGERRLCKAEVGGSSPPSSTRGYNMENPRYPPVLFARRDDRHRVSQHGPTLRDFDSSNERSDELPLLKFLLDSVLHLGFEGRRMLSTWFANAGVRKRWAAMKRAKTTSSSLASAMMLSGSSTRRR